MKKKSLISMVVALSLTATIMVGATLAYLTAQTDEVVNTFTIGNVEITLTEPLWKEDAAKNLQPGASVDKNPTINNVGANDAFVAMTVEGMNDMITAGFSATVNAGWSKINDDGTIVDWGGKALVDGKYAYNSVVKTGEKTEALFSKVLYDANINTAPSDEYVINTVPKDPDDASKGVQYVIVGVADKTFDTEEAAKLYINTELATATVEFNLTVKAFAIQEKGFSATTFDWVDEIDFTQEQEIKETDKNINVL